MKKNDNACYFDRLRRYEEEKRNLRVFGKEYEKAVKELAKKWRI